ncbi:hypothetical protein MUN81_13865 [Hymenobacter sp. 5317J-9]|uniref:hypothetical protein n=1 Tax=Hymenobacter sp. 5317J-9 TaxID=2932250 RepID=UPI001FD69D72|nr:hypothetical protein [Hymenobacter sp. 5317J-9]UOQ96335.1 hypothetical protein MUN81_13865 [Hymenobacter sp. 5317J-9]
MGTNGRSRFSSHLLQWLSVLLLAVPLLLLGLFAPEGLDLFGTAAGSSKRRKPWSAEAKFVLAIFVLLLVTGTAGWLLWHFALSR